MLEDDATSLRAGYGQQQMFDVIFQVLIFSPLVRGTISNWNCELTLPSFFYRISFNSITNSETSLVTRTRNFCVANNNNSKRRDFEKSGGRKQSALFPSLIVYHQLRYPYPSKKGTTYFTCIGFATRTI